MDFYTSHHKSISERPISNFNEMRTINADNKRLYQGANYLPYHEDFYQRYNVKRGLRNADGSGVVAGLTRISNVHGYVMDEGILTPDEGKLTLRGYNIEDLVTAAQAEDRFGYEEVAYLLITGELPRPSELASFSAKIAELRLLTDEYISEFPMTTTSHNIMNVLMRAVLLLYAFDQTPDELTPEHEVDVAMSLLARLPRIAAIAYTARQAEQGRKQLPIQKPVPTYSMAETVLQTLRGDEGFTHDEAMLLDVMLMLHAEHGGGNNSTFTCRVLSSSATDPYSAYAAAIGSLKGPRHGGANAKVTAMHEDIRTHVSNWENEDELSSYLEKIARKQAFDKTGLIYGMGHAVYTLSDPRAQLCKRYARKLAQDKGMGEEFALIERIEKLAPEIITDVRGTSKAICANIDMYTGFVYQMLGVPSQLFTPLFAISRMAGWAAHRMEELFCTSRIIRPAYRPVLDKKDYVELKLRS